MPRLLREGAPSVVARVRRDLIDDNEAPGADEIAELPRGQGVPAQAGEGRQLRSARDARRSWAAPSSPVPGDRARARSHGRLRPARRGQERRCPQRHRRLPAGLAGQRRRHRRSGARRDARMARRRSWPCTFRAGRCRRSAAPATTTTRASRRAFAFLLRCARPTAAGPGAACAPIRRRDRRATSSPAWCCARSPRRRRARTRARRAARPSCWPRASCSPIATPIARRPPSGSSPAEPRFYTDVLDALDGVTAVGLGKENSGVRTAEAYVRGARTPTACGIPARPAQAGDSAPLAAAAKEREPRAG